MTQVKEILYKAMADVRQKYGQNHSCNLRYVLLHSDGVISPFQSVICFAALRNLRVWVDNSSGYSADVLMRNGYAKSESAITHILLDICGDHHTGCDLGNEEYLKAVHRWCDMYDMGLEEQTPEERERHGILVKVADTPLTIDQLGAFLVGFRTFSEYRRYKVFNALMDAEVVPHVSAFMTHIINHVSINHESYWTRGSSGHGIFDYHKMNRPTLDALLNQIHDNPWFLPTDGETRSFSGSLQWGFEPNWKTQWDREAAPRWWESANIKTHLIKDEWHNCYTTFDKNSIINFAKGLNP